MEFARAWDFGFHAGALTVRKWVWIWVVFQDSYDKEVSGIVVLAPKFYFLSVPQDPLRGLEHKWFMLFASKGSLKGLRGLGS